MWVQGKALSEFEAEPHSAQADKVQIVVSKADRNRISDESDIEETKSAPLFYPIAKRRYAKSEAILRRNKLSQISVGVVMVCGINNNAMRNVEGSGRRGRRPLHGL